MIPTLIIVYREVLEAGLIIGIVLAATWGVPGRGRWIGTGVAGGVAGACLVALFADSLAARFSGNGQELFNASVLLLAVFMLAWHNIWMASHGRALAGDMTAVGQSVREGSRPLYALAVVVGVAVLREGSEVVLFLTGIAAGTDAGAGAMVLGGLAGVALGAVTAVLIYRGLLWVPVRHLFTVTTWLITLLAAGMGAQAVLFLHQAGVITAGSATLWDSSAILRDDSLLGRVLHVLVGYSDHPILAQGMVYLLVLATIAGLTRWCGQQDAGIRPPQALPSNPTATER
jgi:high-affinity iron transporter